MLAWFSNARHASKHSPTREQREVYCANTPGTNPGTNPEPEDENEKMMRLLGGGHGYPKNNPTETVQDETHDKVKTTVEDTQEMESTIETQRHPNTIETLKKATDIREKMSAIHIKMGELNKKAKKELTGQDLHNWQVNEMFLAQEGLSLQATIQALEKFRQWEEGKMYPSDLVNWLRQDVFAIEVADKIGHMISESHGNNPKDADELQKLFEEKKLPDVTTPEKWLTYNDSTKLEVVSHINDEADIWSAVEMMEGQINAYEHVLKETGLENLIETKKKDEKEMPDEKKSKEKLGFKAQMRLIVNKVEWASPIEMYNGTKDWWEAFKNTWKAPSKLRQAKAAQKFGKLLRWLPGGKEVRQDLDVNLESRQNEEKEKFYKFLKSANFSYKPLKRIFDENTHEPNRMRAIIEFAAEKSYLFRIDEEWREKDPLKRKVFGHTLGALIGDLWEEAPEGEGGRSERVQLFFKGLLSKQTTGQNEEFEKGARQAEKREDTKLIIGDFDTELRGFNIFRSIGMAEVAMKKGKTPEVSAWLSTTFWQAMRDDPKLREVCHAGILELFGNKAGFGHPGFTNQYTKIEKPTFAGWNLKGAAATEKEFADLNHYARAMTKIENRLNAAFGNWFNDIEDSKSNEYKRRKAALNHLVAMVFSGQVVDLSTIELDPPKGFKFEIEGMPKGKGIINIFDPEFDEYRTKILVGGEDYKGGVNMQADDDFFKNSEIILLPETPIKILLTLDRNDQFQHQGKANNFLQQILVRHDAIQADVKKGLPAEALINYRHEMQKKLQRTIDSFLSHRPVISREEVVTDQYATPIKEELALAGLFRRNMLDKAMLQPYANKKDTLGYDVLSQLNNNTISIPIGSPLKKPTTSKPEPDTIEGPGPSAGRGGRSGRGGGGRGSRP